LRNDSAITAQSLCDHCAITAQLLCNHCATHSSSLSFLTFHSFFTTHCYLFSFFSFFFFNQVDMSYFDTMWRSKIVVTVNPTSWEGDFRLWEAMSSGALVFVDYMSIPEQFPLVGGGHVVFYNNSNRADLWGKLDYYRAHPLESRRIAVNGYLHAMKHHRTVNLADYVLRTAHKALVMQNSEEMLRMNASNYWVEKKVVDSYTYTGQELYAQALAQEKSTSPEDFTDWNQTAPYWVVG
jgi:hypothetical protein